MLTRDHLCHSKDLIMRNRPLVADMLAEQFSALVRAELEHQGLTIAELARRMGLTRPNVSRTLSRPGTIQSSTVCAFFDALGLDPDLRTKRKATKPPKEGAQ